MSLACAANAPPVLRDVTLVMPCLNEAATVGECVQCARQSISAGSYALEIVVCDNASMDSSASIAAAAGAKIVHCARLGYGNAIRQGVDGSVGYWIVMGDADLSYDFGCLDPFIEALRSDADLVVGNRFQGGIAPGAMPWKNRHIGNPVLTSMLNALFGTTIGDSQCGLRAFSREAFDRMRLECEGMELATEMLIKASRLGLKVAEVPVTLSCDGRDRPPHLAPWRDGLRIVALMARFSPHGRLVTAAILLLAAARALIESASSLALGAVARVRWARRNMKCTHGWLGQSLSDAPADGDRRIAKRTRQSPLAPGE